MLIRFDKNGILKEQLTYDSAPYVGGTNFKIFAYFEDLDIDSVYGSAVIRFQRPDLQGSEYPSLFMSRTEITFNASLVPNYDPSTSYFKAGTSYKVYVFNFNDIIDTDEPTNPIPLLDAPGLWQTSITLINSVTMAKNVVGKITFNVASSVSEVDDEPTEITYSVISNNIAGTMATKMNMSSTNYVRYCEDFVIAAAANNVLPASVYVVGCSVYDAATDKIFRINSIAPGATEDYVTVTSYTDLCKSLQILDVSLSDVLFNIANGGVPYVMKVASTGQYYLARISNTGSGSGSWKFEIENILNKDRFEGTLDNGYISLNTVLNPSGVYYKPYALVSELEAGLDTKQDVIDSEHKLASDLVDDTGQAHQFVSATEKATWNDKQDRLVSGVNIKTINDHSIVGPGNLTIQDMITIDQTVIENSTNPVSGGAVYNGLQDVRAVAEGKTDSYILSYTDNIAYVKAHTAVTAGAGKAYLYSDPNKGINEQTPTDITAQVQSGEYDEISSSNALFNSPNDTVNVKTGMSYPMEWYIILRLTGSDFALLRYVYNNNFRYFKRGDIIYVMQVNVPDRWNINGADFYALEAKSDLSAYEEKANKVQSLTSSSTEVQYPSARAVYNELIKRLEIKTVDDNGTTISSSTLLTNLVNSGKPYIISYNNEYWLARFKNAYSYNYIFELENLVSRERYANADNAVANLENITIGGLLNSSTSEHAVYYKPYALQSSLDNITTYHTFPASWTTNSTIAAFCADVDADSSAVAGMVYLGELTCSDLPFNGNADAVVEVIDGTGTSGKVIHIAITSGDIAPYRWEYTYWNVGHSVSGWIAFQNQITEANTSSVQSLSYVLGFDANGDIKKQAAERNLEIHTIDSNAPLAVLSTNGTNAFVMEYTYGGVQKFYLSTIKMDTTGTTTYYFEFEDMNSTDRFAGSSTNASLALATILDTAGDYYAPYALSSAVSALETTVNNKLDKAPVNNVDLIDSSTNKINTVYIPDSFVGQLIYGGVVNATTAVATLSESAKTKLGTASSSITLTNDTTAITGYEANEGIYYVVNTAGTFAGIAYDIGDWLISTGSAWQKIDNTDEVTSVAISGSNGITSSNSTAQTGSVSTTISLATAYGDTVNPYASKTANYVLAAPDGSAGAPSFRALVAGDISSGSGNEGKVLTASSSGGASWITPDKPIHFIKLESLTLTEALRTEILSDEYVVVIEYSSVYFYEFSRSSTDKVFRSQTEIIHDVSDNRLAISLYSISVSSSSLSISFTAPTYSAVRNKALPKNIAGTNNAGTNATAGQVLTANGSGNTSWASIPAATYDASGTIKLGSSTAATQTVEAVSATAGRQYAVQVDSNGRASVNVPWVSGPTYDLATTQDINRLFETEYTITTTVTNGTYSGDTSIYDTETATVTVTANTGYSLPSSITVVGASYIYDSTTGVITLSNATGSVSISVVCEASSGPAIDPVFANNDWATIKSVAESGNASNYWNVGDTKTDTGTDTYTRTLRISDMSGLYGKHLVIEEVNVEGTDGSGSSGVQWNPSSNTDDDSCYNNYNISNMRTTVLPSVKLRLSNELQAILTNTTYKVAKNGMSTTVLELSDELFLPAQKEMTSSASYARSEESAALTTWNYYTTHTTSSDRIKYDSSSTARTYWLRSPYSGYTDYVVLVDFNGGFSINGAYGTSRLGFCFAL